MATYQRLIMAKSVSERKVACDSLLPSVLALLSALPASQAQERAKELVLVCITMCESQAIGVCMTLVSLPQGCS
jgi:hypothetical protein